MQRFLQTRSYHAVGFYSIANRQYKVAKTYDFTETLEPIRGMFWFPDAEDSKFPGVLHLEAGRSARLDTAAFTYGGFGNFFPGIPKGKPTELSGEAVTRAMFPPGKRLILGHDEQGHPITLVDCHTNGSHSTLAMESHSYSCRAAVFGIHMTKDDIKGDGLRLGFDHLDTWLGRRAFSTFSTDYETDDGQKKLSKIEIPFARNTNIDLNLPGYSSSFFNCSWTVTGGNDDFSLSSRTYLELYFAESTTLEQLIHELQQWQWFFRLATRTSARLRNVAIFRNDVRFPMKPYSLEPLWIWMKRDSDGSKPTKRTTYDFHFSFGDVESTFSKVIEMWQGIQQSWAAVLHRYFAISQPRGLWINEEFLFLAQAIESLYRSRTGDTDGKGLVDRAAKDAYQNAPEELQEILGKRGGFIERFRKSRNYWTHYGEPSPSTDPLVLDGDELLDFNEHLRWIVEAALLDKLAVPTHCVANAWNQRWKSHTVAYE